MDSYEISAYLTIILLMYCSDGRLHYQDERIFRVIKQSPNAIKPAIERLVVRGSLKRDADGWLSKGRVTLELSRAETALRLRRDRGETDPRPTREIEPTSANINGLGATEGRKERKNIYSKGNRGGSFLTKEQKKAAWQSNILHFARSRLTEEQYAQFSDDWANDRPHAKQMAEEFDKAMRRAKGSAP